MRDNRSARAFALLGGARRFDRLGGLPIPRQQRCQLVAHLPRVELVVDVEDKACPCCGGTLHVIGEDRAEMLDYVPAQVRVRVIRRPRYGCRACEEAVVTAVRSFANELP